MSNPDIPGLSLPHLNSGKVRESYELGPDHLVFVTTDRISAFDSIMPEPIPNKGRILNGMTEFWLDEVSDIVPNQTATMHPELPNELSQPYYLGRTAVVQRAEMLQLECIVRGHITGSAWGEYTATGRIPAMKLPEGMEESEKFDKPIFTPSTKATEGHDVNISFDDAVDIVGGPTAEYLRDITVKIFERMYERAAAVGITMADTKFELGRLANGLIILCDEVGTPDSSRLWPSDEVVVGQTPRSFDKQYLRDYLKSTGWDRNPPAPHLPDDVVANTAEKYQTAYEKITGRQLADVPGVEL